MKKYSMTTIILRFAKEKKMIKWLLFGHLNVYKIENMYAQLNIQYRQITISNVDR